MINTGIGDFIIEAAGDLQFAWRRKSDWHCWGEAKSVSNMGGFLSKCIERKFAILNAFYVHCKYSKAFQIAAGILIALIVGSK